MSIERVSKYGTPEGIRFNFADEEAEREFHSKEFKCEKQIRKEQPIKTGVLDYFPDAIRAVAHCSWVGNEQHNPGTELHWDRSKSGDELDALSRHLLDAGTLDSDGVRHSAKVAWRALANLQKEIEAEKLEAWQEEILDKTREDEKDLAHFMYDGEECDGLLGSHPLCCTDYCPCKEDEINSRIDIIGRNGNDGEHYGLCGAEYDDLKGGHLTRYPEPDGVWVATSTETPCGWDNTNTNEVQKTEGKKDDKQ